MSELHKISPGAEVSASNVVRSVGSPVNMPHAGVEVPSIDPKDYLKQVIRSHVLRPGWVLVVYNSAPWERISGSIKSISTKDGFQACLVGKRSSINVARIDIALVHWFDKSTSGTGRISYIGPLELTGVREGTDASYEE